MKTTKNRTGRFIFCLAIFMVLSLIALFKFSDFYFPIFASKEQNTNAAINPRELKFQIIQTELIKPNLIDFHFPAQSLLFSSGPPAKLGIFSRNSQSKLISGDFSQAKSIVSVRDKNSRFPVGEIFTGFENGLIRRISDDGLTISEFMLPKENSSVEGLAIDGADARIHISCPTESNNEFYLGWHRCLRTRRARTARSNY